jgi:hypothetical protein
VGRLALIAGVAALCASSFVACGEDATLPPQAKAFQAELAQCEFMDSRVRLHDSGISCAEANAIRVVLASGAPNPQVVGEGKDRWSCWSLPPKHHPLTLRCEQDGREFTVEDAAR